MRRTVLSLILSAVALSGCDKTDNKPNPEMKVPNIPPGRGNKDETPKNPKG